MMTARTTGYVALAAIALSGLCFLVGRGISWMVLGFVFAIVAVAAGIIFAIQRLHLDTTDNAAMTSSFGNSPEDLFPSDESR